MKIRRWFHTARDKIFMLDDASRPWAGRAAGVPLRQSRPSDLSPDRLREILTRLKTGYYDTPEVIDRVALRISDEFDRAIPAH